MKLIAKKPCSFGGEKFFIGEEVPEELVANPAAQEKLGVIAISNAEGKAPVENSIQITVKNSSDGERITVIPATPEEIQRVFFVMQQSADEAVKAISEIQSDNVLMLIHAADSRKTVKNAAKEQADKLSSTESVLNESGKGNTTTGANTEGADT